MFLPKISKKLVSTIVLTSFLLTIFSVPVLANSSNNNSQQNPSTSSNQYTIPGYKIVPIPSTSDNPQVTPIPTATQSPKIQQAILGLGNPFDWLRNLPGNLLGGLLGLVQDATLALFQAGVYVVEHTGLGQLVGDMMDKVDSLLTATANGDTAQIQQLDRTVAENPSSLGNTGLLGLSQQATTGLLALPVPISSGQYFASINPFAQAQAESGEKTLEGSGIILNIWKKVRDAAFALSVVVLVIIGFMIMLRVPINPRTVVNVQNSLPKIVIALLLITFSFAIAGLMIDLTRIIAAFLDNLVSVPLAAKIGIPMIFFLIASILAILLSASISLPGAGTVAAIVLLLLLLILAIIILVVFFNLIFKLITRYVIFLLLTIFAPIFFLFGALPGAEGLMINWFRRAAAALLAIPFTGLVLNLSFAIGFSGFGAISTPDYHIEPLNLLGGTLEKVFGWIFIAPLIGLGLFFFATKVPDIVDEMFGNRPLASRAGLGPMAVIGAPFAALQTAGNLGRAWSGTQRMREAAGRFLSRPSTSYPGSVERIAYNQPLRHLSPERRRALEPTLRKAGAIFTEGGEEKIRAGTLISMPPEPQEGLRAALSRRVTRGAGRLLGQEVPPSKPVAKSPEQLAEEEAIARDKAKMSPGGRGRRTGFDGF